MAIISTDLPNSVFVGAPDTTVILTGSDFFPDTIARFNGTPVATTFIDGSHLSIVIPHAMLGTPGTYPIDVLAGFDSLNFIQAGDSSHTHGAVVPGPTNGLSGLTELTVSEWIRPLGTAPISLAPIWDINDGSDSYYEAFLSRSGVGSIDSWDELIIFVINSPTGGTVSMRFPFGGDLSFSSFSHIAFSLLGAVDSFHAATLSAYLNGAALSGSVIGGTLNGLLGANATPSNLGIATQLGPSGGTNFEGNVANAHVGPVIFAQRYYDLSDVNTYLYNGGNPLDPIAAGAPGLWSWWDWQGTPTDALGHNDVTLYHGLGYTLDFPGTTNEPSATVPFTVLGPPTGMRPWNRELGVRQARIAAFAKQALGEITVVDGAHLVDGDSFTMGDGVVGHTPVTFEYDSNGMVGLGHVPIHFYPSDDLVTIAKETIESINGVLDGLRVSAFAELVDGVIGVANDLPGVAGNVTITKSVTDPGFLVQGLSGGTDADPVLGGIESALEGDYVFALGYKLPDLFHLFFVGDYSEVSQDADFGSAKIVRIRAIVRPPESMPSGLAWRFSIRIDGAEFVGRNFDPQRDRKFIDLAANVSSLTGNHTLALRVELVNV